MKQFIIVTLICVNLALVAALVFHSTASPAQAQVRGGGADYLMLTARVDENNDAVYVIDLGNRRMLAWFYDKSTDRLRPLPGRRLEDDFRVGR